MQSIIENSIKLLCIMKNTFIFKNTFIYCILILMPFKLIAQTTSQPLTGSCAGIINTSNIYSALIENNGKSIDREGNSLAFKINFDNNKIELISNSFDITNLPNNTRIFSSSSIFTLTDSKRMSGTKTIIFSAIDDNEKFTIELTLIPVNSNNTFLIQGVNVGFSGVCQKI